MKENTQEKSQVKQKILLYLQEKGVTPYEFYKLSGVTRGILTQNNGINEDNMARFLAYAQDINTEWLLRGEGEMLKKSRGENLPINQEPTDDRPKHSASYTAIDDSDGIPLIPIEAMAGIFRGEADAISGAHCEKLIIPGVTADYVIIICGDSMQPNFRSGDMVACSDAQLSSVFFQWGRPYIIDTAQGVLLKRIRPGSAPDRVTLVSDNPDYAPFEVECSDIYHIGLVRALVRIF